MRKTQWMVVCAVLLLTLMALALSANVKPLQARTALLTQTPTVPPANVNLVQNGDFALGVHNWAAFSAAMQVVNIGGANGNVMELARWAGTTYGGFYQFMPYPAPANGVFEFTFQLGNMSNTNRVINMLLRDADWQDIHSCFINLPPFAPLQNFSMTLRTNQFWQNIVLQGWIYVGDYIGNPPLPFRLDNLNVQYRPTSSFSGATECPGAAIPASPTPSRTPTRTNTATPTLTAPPITPTNTYTPTHTPTQTNTPTPTVSPTFDASQLVVTNLNDSGPGSLRAAIAYANAYPSDDTITFAVSGVIFLLSELRIQNHGSLVIDGAEQITLSGNSFNYGSIADGLVLTLDGLGIMYGNSLYAGAIHNPNGIVTIANSFISRNSASFGAGAIANGGIMTITNTEISGNHRGNIPSPRGGAILNGGTMTINDSYITDNTSERGQSAAIFNDGTMTINNSEISRNTTTEMYAAGGIFNTGIMTISNTYVGVNSALNNGTGGIVNQEQLVVINSLVSDNYGSLRGGIVSSDDLTIMNSTVANNSAPNFGGVYLFNGTFALYNSIVAGNDSDCVMGQNFTSAPDIQHSLIEDGSCGIVSGVNGNLTGDPWFDSAYGLSPSSPAINAGDNSLIPSGITTDLAGNPRIIQDIVDMGAIELQLGTPTLSPTVFVSLTPSNTFTPSATWTPTPTPTVTSTPTTPILPSSTPTPTLTDTLTSTPTFSDTPTATSTYTPAQPTDTATATNTQTPTPTDTPTSSPTPTETPAD